LNVQVPIFPRTSVVVDLVDFCPVILVVVVTVAVIVIWLVVRAAVSLAVHDAGSLTILAAVVLTKWLFSSASM